MKFLFGSLFLVVSFQPFAQNVSKEQKQKTAFQTSSPWIPQIDMRSDMAIVYGSNDRKEMTFEQRVQSWRDKGYNVGFMTGIAWGEYPDYFLGKWDGKNHINIVQVTRNGDSIFHGHNIPYVVPVQSYIDYMKTGVVKKVIDADISTIFLEEPEFWMRAGYSTPFKEEWEKYYGFAWKPQHESPENTYLSSKLKYHLYYTAIKQVSDYAKQYGKSKGKNIKVYIATHSLVNYSSWQIVSPEASLASLPGIDGYIAQVWTGTSREPTYYDGVKKERVFENAFLEYGSMRSMTDPTGRKVYFLTDPIEDWPRDWADYKQNYQATFTAEILYPTIDNYEVMPWPERIYTRPYKLANSDKEVLIPQYYSTQMQVMINALNNMPLTSNKISGNNDIGVLMGNSLMFQRFPAHNGYDDPQFSNFYGQTLPLLKHGIPVQTVHMENLAYPNTLRNIKVLIMSYSNMKPMNADVHRYIANWVKQGGILIYCGKDDDPYQNIMEWWNTHNNHYATASQHLFQLLGISSEKDVIEHSVGKGAVYIIRKDPKEFVLNKNGQEHFVDIVKRAYEVQANAGKLIFKNSFYLERGIYDIVSVMDENNDTSIYKVKGKLIDLFDPTLPAISEKDVKPGTQSLLLDINRVTDKNKPQVLAAAARIYNEHRIQRTYSFVVKSPANTINAMRVLLPSKAKQIIISDSNGKTLSKTQTSWDEGSHTLFLSFNNSPDGVKVAVEW